VIFLTGATGLVGRQVAELLATRGTPMTALVRDVPRASWLRELGAQLHTGPITDPATWRAVDDVTAIVHCAAVISGGKSWEEYAGPNIESTRLAAARARELGVPFVQLSSVAVYGGSTTEPVGSVAEGFRSSPMRSGAWYGRSKRESEELVWREAGRGLKAIALRPCVIYGPHDRLFFPKLLKAARRGVLPLIGRGDSPMALVHARSVAQGVLAALDTKEGWGRPYNITGDAPISPRQVVQAIGRGLRKKVFAPALPAGMTLGAADLIDALAGSILSDGLFPGTVRTAVGYWRGGDPYDASAARKILGWHPQIDHSMEIERLARAS
jgi:nucleoside-diphosphate-sugar epimerase